MIIFKKTGANYGIALLHDAPVTTKGPALSLPFMNAGGIQESVRQLISL
jgi:hypothetical protein